MKKKRILQTVLIASLALIVGFFAGIFLVGSPPDAYVLPGSISRLNSYRNVKITENDIALRNELLGDTEKQEMYKNYLNYYYIRAMRTSAEVTKSVTSASMVPEFQGTFLDYAESLDGFAKYLDAARTDILKALDVVTNLEAQSRVPVVEYLNQANNVIARMRQYDNVLIDFMIAIETFLDLHPTTEFSGLADAHDLLAMSLMESAVVTQSKPMLKLLDKKELANSEEGVKELLMSMDLGVLFESQLNLDAEKMGVFNAEQLGAIHSDAGKLAAGFTDAARLGTVYFAADEKLGQQILFSGERLQLVLDAENLSNVLSAEQWGKIIFTDTEVLGLK